MNRPKKGRAVTETSRTRENAPGMTDEHPKSLLHAVVHYPRLDSPALTDFRRKHDPFAELIAEHLTLVFPVPVSLEAIRSHTRDIGSRVAPFRVRITGVSRTWDHWLYLEVQEGRRQVIALHDRLYSGPLQPFLRSDLPYEPHVGIGFFGRGPYDPLDPEEVELDAEGCREARAEAVDFGIDAVRTVDSLTIVRLDTEANTLVDVADVPLGS